MQELNSVSSIFYLPFLFNHIVYLYQLNAPLGRFDRAGGAVVRARLFFTGACTLRYTPATSSIYERFFRYR